MNGRLHSSHKVGNSNAGTAVWLQQKYGKQNDGQQADGNEGNEQKGWHKAGQQEWIASVLQENVHG
jgi:hypothetical protein